ncbi:MAG: hypothetical protein HY052_04070 [Proteobacteria bacterium]|nr:hypothetical protein [Pseudomonadota bacterium]
MRSRNGMLIILAGIMLWLSGCAMHPSKSSGMAKLYTRHIETYNGGYDFMGNIMMPGTYAGYIVAIYGIEDKKETLVWDRNKDRSYTILLPAGKYRISHSCDWSSANANHSGSLRDTTIILESGDLVRLNVSPEITLRNTNSGGIYCLSTFRKI